MKRILSLTLSLALLALLCSAAMARPDVAGVDAKNFEHFANKVNAAPSVARADTVFLFAASGAGAYGSAGTDDRGFTFDDLVGGTSATAGFTTTDKTAQDGNWWHLASTTLCAGTTTDMSTVLPFDPLDTSNDYAVWCGRESVCGWSVDTGYGNNWDQYIALDATWTTGVTLDFSYSTFFEGDTFDYLEVMVMVDGVATSIYEDRVGSGVAAAAYSVSSLATDFPDATTLGDVIVRFTSDGAWSDQDGDFPTNLGAVWADNFTLTVDGVETLKTDFEDGIVPAGMTFTAPAGAGDYATLYSNLFSEDICVINNTYAWAFFDLNTFEPEFPIPVIAYGPPYIDNAIDSPLLEKAHAIGDATGAPLSLTATTQVSMEYQVYFDMPLNCLIFVYWQVAAQTTELPCQGGWKDDNGVTFGDGGTWNFQEEIVTQQVVESAAGGTVTGLRMRMSALDQAGVWTNVYGDGTGHTPAPYIDNLRLMLVEASAVGWSIDQFNRFQDNFPEAGTGKVRIDNSNNVEPAASPTLVIGDSVFIELNMDLVGGIKTSFNADAGEDRPELYIWYRIAAGPHAGMIDPLSADEDATDGSYVPYVGSADWYGETWMYAQLDSAAYQGVTQDGKFSVELADNYYEAGDIIQFFYRAESNTGVIETRPGWALSTDPELRGYYRVRCLPTAGTTMLLVDDGSRPYYGINRTLVWREAFAYNGYTGYDTYTVQAPTSGLGNGLAGRAEIGDIDQYEVLLWDSGTVPEACITDQGDPDDKVFDDVLLTDWLSNATHNTYLWVMGDLVATDLGLASGFLNTQLGTRLLSADQYIDDYTGLLSLKVAGVHPALEYLGSDPTFWVEGGCPSLDDFSVVEVFGANAVVSHEWEDNGGTTAVAGIFNSDPDGNGTDVSDGGHTNRTLFNPFSYHHVLDDGYGVSAGVDYSKKFVGDVLNNLFSYVPNTTPIGNPNVAPEFTKLQGNFPNPFNPVTNIKFSLAANEHVNLSVYDITGRLVKELVNERMTADDYQIQWNGKDNGGNQVASGVYFYKLNAGDYSATEKMVMVK